MSSNSETGEVSFSELVEAFSGKVSFAKQVEIFGENESAEYFYKLVSGTVRTYKMLPDGRRQVCAFYLPGDFFGWEAAGNYSISAETIIDSKVVAIKRSTVLGWAEQDKRIHHALWTIMDAELARSRAHVLLLVKTAKERMAAFLLEMSHRSQSEGQIELPMGRQDIADYLGLTIETVSRSLSELEAAAAISLPSSRCIVLKNRPALVKFSGSLLQAK